MRIDRIDRALSVCRSHLEETMSFNTAIDSLLAGIVLVVAYAEFESFVKETIEDRSRPQQDFRYRGILSSQLSELLIQLGGEYQAEFKLRTSEQPRAVSYYNNIISNRHHFAHKSGANDTFQVTFQEVERFYTEGHIVLDFFAETVLSIPPAGSQH